MTETVARKRSPTKKTIYDWSQLVAMFSDPPPAPSGAVAEHVAGKARGFYDRKSGLRWVQIAERLIAVASQTRIELVWAHTPKECALDCTTFTGGVSVFPAGGGRTSYRIDDSVNGWFANRYLPMNARDRRTKSLYRSDNWFSGQAGVYQRGSGPYYADAGPDFMNGDLAALREELAGCSFLPPQWCEAAMSFAEKISAAVAPFRDTIVRYEAYCDDDSKSWPTMKVSMRGRGEITSPYGLRVRLKSPIRTDGGRAEQVPDFSAFITGPHPMYWKSRESYFGAELLYPNGPHAACEYSGKLATGIPHAFYAGMSEVVEAARQWAASQLFIPCA